jgi:HAD superfamily hydrolase (TIGR01484 family)
LLAKAFERDENRSMQPLGEWSSASDAFFKTRSIFAFDLDETLTTHGQLSPRVLEALSSLQKAKIRTVIVTGRPAGWADALIKLLPLDAVLAESGACIFRKMPGSAQTAPEVLFWSESGYQSERKGPVGSQDPRFAKIFQNARARFPRIRVAADQFGRLYDFAIDFAEFVSPPLSFAEADEIRKIYENEGATAKVSSIHVNGWFGAFSKFMALEHLTEKIWKKNIRESLVYFGDSPNDASLFEKVDLSVGVQNIQDFASLKFTRPKFITDSREGDGVAEAIQHFLARK